MLTREQKLTFISLSIIGLSFVLFAWLMIELVKVYGEEEPFEWRYVFLDFGIMGVGVVIFIRARNATSPWKQPNVWAVIVVGTILLFAIVEIFGIQYPNFRNQLSWQYTAQYVFDVKDPYHTNETMKLGVNFRDRVFTEHNAIPVYVILQPHANHTHEGDFILIFNGSQCDQSPTHYGIPDDNYKRMRIDCILPLGFHPNNGTYTNTTAPAGIVYPRGGTFYVSLADENGDRVQKIDNPESEYIVIDTLSASSDLIFTRLTFNITILSGLAALSAATIAVFLEAFLHKRNSRS